MYRDYSSSEQDSSQLEIREILEYVKGGVMNDQMKEKEQAVLGWMKHLGDEFEYIATSPLQEKYKLSLIMIYIDIFSQRLVQIHRT